jgi:hypothetical protein
MLAIATREYQRPLAVATEELISTSTYGVAPGQILSAVARAKIHVGRGYGLLDLEPPPADEYVSLVIGLAKQELELHAQDEPA